MPDSRTYYVIADDNCKFESMTKEQILAAITQAVESHSISDVDTGFVTTLKERNAGNGLKFWVGTTAQYNALDPKEENCFYILSDDTELEDLETAISNLDLTNQTQQSAINDLQDGLTKKYGRILLSQEVAYGPGLGARISTGEYQLSDFKIVSVDGILCSVTVDEEDTSIIYICGTGTTNNTNINVVETKAINITCGIPSAAPDITLLATNSSVSVVTEYVSSSQQYEVVNITGIAINKIVGIA